jgi:diadenosine tetraphosphate (Ap4A) HIT family hydrolase
LCDGPGGELVYAGAAFRLIRTDEGGFPAFYRLVWNRHVREFSELAPAERRLCLEALVAVEQVLLAHLRPAKINLASLGNAVPHLHWHVVARFDWDSHFPAPVWAAALRQAPPVEVARVAAARRLMEQDLGGPLAALEASHCGG